MVLKDSKYILNLDSDVPIWHIKVKGTTSPSDENWTYWSTRIGKQSSRIDLGVKTLATLRACHQLQRLTKWVLYAVGRWRSLC